MAISDEQNTRLTAILTALDAEFKRLPERSANFVRDQMKRHDEHGDRIFMSPKQWAWLEDLFKTYAGGEAPLDDRPADDEDNSDHDPRDDDDDSIPF